MKTYLLIYILSLVSVLVMGQSGSINNITALQRTDGSMIVDIYYDLGGSDPEYYVTAQVSFDGGLSFENMNATSEDIGEGVNPGNGKHIIWHFGYQFPNQSVSNARIKLTAAYPKPWQCGDPLLDNRDGQSYNTVKIGSQCWMAENLNYGTIRILGYPPTNNGIAEKWCYANESSNCNIYGGLYNWPEAMNYSDVPGSQGICPDGWHIPSHGSLSALVNGLGGGYAAGQKMKTSGTLYWYYPGGTNESGFSALGAGFVNQGFAFMFLNNTTEFWSSSVDNNQWPYFLELYSYSNYAYVFTAGQSYGHSIRCLRNWNEPPAMPINPSPANGSTGQPLNGTLTWDCTDPDGDALIYDVYFGTTNPPAIHTAGLTNETFNPGTLSPNTTYYWKVLAFDTDGQTNLGTTVWSFTTQ